MQGYETFTDLELVERAKSGNDRAFAEIVDRYEGVVAATVFSMVGQNDAEEVGQIAMIKFYNALGNYKGEASLKTYITRIAINAALDHIRSKKRFLDRFRSLDDEIIEESASLSNQGEALEKSQIVQIALSKLKPEFRSVAVLRLVQGYSTNEVSEILGVANGTVLSRLSRARKILSSYIKEQ